MDHVENNASNNSSIISCLYVAEVYLSSRCLATVVGYTYRQSLMEGIYEVRH
jgi:hypothetical protein